MPNEKSKSRSGSRQQQPTATLRSQPTTPATEPPEVVDPIWLVKAIGVTIVAALVCGYLTLCLLFYQGQWQLVLHPSRATATPAAIDGVSVQTVHFAVDETASPQLTGWLVAAEPSARYAAYTVLYLPSGDGSLANAIPSLSVLHAIGVNLFAFDYRGYGQSAPVHPDRRRMTEDAASAWQYLTVSRAIPPSKIVLFGDGVGAALAAQLAAAHHEAPAVLMQSPRPDLISTVLADPRTQSLPVRALFHEDFEIRAIVSTLKTPKLFLLMNEDGPRDKEAAEIESLTSGASTLKNIASLHGADLGGTIYREQITRFFDAYLR